MEPEPTLAYRIAWWREDSQLSQAELARRIGVTPSAVCHWEQGDTNPSMGNLLKIAEACGTNLRRFLGRLDAAPTRKRSAGR